MPYERPLEARKTIHLGGHGGVANNEGVVQALSQVLGAPVRTHEDSQLCGAIGAALLGLERLRG